MSLRAGNTGEWEEAKAEGEMNQLVSASVRAAC